MREINRINRICNKLAKLWAFSPDCRFYQMMINHGLMGDDDGKWCIEDGDFEKWIDEEIK